MEHANTKILDVLNTDTSAMKLFNMPDSPYAIQAIPYLILLLNFLAFWFAYVTPEQELKRHVYRAFLIFWATFWFPCLAAANTTGDNAFAIMHTTVILYIALPFDIIRGYLKKLRNFITGNRNELPRYEQEKVEL